MQAEAAPRLAVPTPTAGSYLTGQGSKKERAISGGQNTEVGGGHF